MGTKDIGGREVALFLQTFLPQIQPGLTENTRENAKKKPSCRGAEVEQYPLPTRPTHSTSPKEP